MSNIKREFKGNVGLFLVCAELSKLNLIALPTSRNTPGYDAVVLNPDTKASMGIQVKCTDVKKGWPITSYNWNNYKKVMEDKIVTDFIFVDISNPEKTDYYIIEKEDLKNIALSGIEDQAKRYLQKHCITPEQMKDDKKKDNLYAIGIGDIEKYSKIENHKNNWACIISRLK